MVPSAARSFFKKEYFTSEEENCLFLISTSLPLFAQSVTNLRSGKQNPVREALIFRHFLFQTLLRRVLLDHFSRPATLSLSIKQEEAERTLHSLANSQQK